MNNKGVFGLTSVQAFFTIILGLALLAYVIVVIMATLSTSTILPSSTLSTSVVNESGWINQSGYTLSNSTISGFSSPAITIIWNATTSELVTAGNYTLTGSLLTNATSRTWSAVLITYSYNYNSGIRNGANDLLANTSGGIVSFFSSINPVYSILAILVIILVLIVLVRVVTGGAGSGRTEYSPQL